MEFMHCLIIGIIFAAIIHMTKTHIVSQVPARLRKHITRNGLVRGYLVYAFERK